MKFGRSYHMTVTGRTSVPGRPVEISVNFPLTLEFNITHNIFAAANTADFSIYNLSAGNRSEISFNQFLKSQPYPIKLRAGYISQNQLGLAGTPDSLPLIFDGFSNIAYTERSGGDLITRINAFDNGDITTGKPAAVFPKNFSIAPSTTFPDMVRQVMSALRPNVAPGNVLVTPVPDPVGSRGRSFTGTVWTALLDLAREAAGAKVYIENGVCNMLGQNDTLGGNNLGVLQASTGLIGIPRYTGANILVSCVFEPSLTIGKTLELNGTFLNNGTGPSAPCKIVAYTHRGTISGVESGDAVSDITLMSVNTPLGVNS